MWERKRGNKGCDHRLRRFRHPLTSQGDGPSKSKTKSPTYQKSQRPLPGLTSCVEGRKKEGKGRTQKRKWRIQPGVDGYWYPGGGISGEARLIRQHSEGKGQCERMSPRDNRLEYRFKRVFGKDALSAASMSEFPSPERAGRGGRKRLN